MKLCFISYARNSNLDGRLTRFVEKLEEQLPGRLPHGTKRDDVVFFDVQSIETGQEWMSRLADATRLCKVCVCFYSPPYFSSEYSGREVQVFLERVKAWGQQAANAGQQAGAIIPVIWVPYEPLPTVLKPFQFSNAKQLPALYIKEGLLALAMRKSRRDAYNAVLYQLAGQIAATVQAVTLPQGAAIQSFDAISSAFHGAPTPVRYGALLVLLTDRTKRARPFAIGGASVDTLIEGVASRSGVTIREVKLAAGADAEIGAAIAAREMPVVIAERSSLESLLNAPLVKNIAAALDGSATVMVFGDPVPNAVDAAAALRALASQRFAPWYAGSGSTAGLVATDSATFLADLEKRLRKARGELIAADPAARAADVGLETEAEARGISVGTQPVLTGPGV